MCQKLCSVHNVIQLINQVPLQPVFNSSPIYFFSPFLIKFHLLVYIVKCLIITNSITLKLITNSLVKSNTGFLFYALVPKL